MPLVPFVGPSYKLNTPESDVQRVVNMYPVANEVQGGKTGVYLEAIPGLDVFSPVPAPPPPAEGGPWLYYPTEGEGPVSLAPIHKQAGEGYSAISGPPEPFSYGVGVTDDAGGGNNTNSVVDVIIPLYSGNAIPTEGQYTWEPADGSGIVPTFSTENPSGGAWVGPTMVVGLSAYGVGEWAGGVLTLYANNDPDSGQWTIITFLPSGFIYPPVSVYYGPLA